MIHFRDSLTFIADIFGHVFSGFGRVYRAQVANDVSVLAYLEDSIEVFFKIITIFELLKQIIYFP